MTKVTTPARSQSIASAEIWPQDALAYYELAYTLRTQQIIATGERPDTPGINEKLKYSPEVNAAMAQCRRYSPFMQGAYHDAGDPEIVQAYDAP